MMKYRDRQPITKARFLEAISTSPSEDLTDSIMDAVESINDYEWLLKTYKSILEKKKDKWVIGSTIVALGEMAMIHEDIDRRELLKILEPFLKYDEFRAWAEDAISDIESSSAQ